MSLNEVKYLIWFVQDRMGYMPICSSRFKAGLIVSRRLLRLCKNAEKSISDYNIGNYA